MNITVEKQDCSANIAIEIPADRVSAERGKIVKSFSSQANIKGFRKGKAPAKVIEKRYASDIKAELEQRLVNEAVSEAIKKEELKVLNVAIPSPPQYGEDESLKVEAVAILAPSFDLPVYKGLSVSVPDEEVTDLELEQGLDNMVQRMATYNDTEGPLEDDHFAVIDFTTNIDGKPVEEVIGKTAGFEGDREGLWIKIEEDSFLPGFVDQIKGLKVGDEKTATVTINEDFPIEALHGKEVNFEVVIKETKEQILPEINDEWAASIMPDATLEDLKEILKDSLAEEKKKNIDNSKVNQIMEQLLGDVSFNLPEELLASETQANIRSMIRQALDEGMSDEVLKEQQSDIETAAKERALTSLRSNFVLQEIAEVEEIEVNDMDIITRVGEMAEQAKKSVKVYLKELQKNNGLDQVRNSLLLSKTIDFLLDSANVSITEPEQEDA